MKLATILLAVLLTGCSTITAWIPSFWDDNQSARIITVRQEVARIDCSQPQRAQLAAVDRDLEWFALYSDSKGMAQGDVLRLVQPMQETVASWITRGEGSPAYCALKKRILVEQSERAARAVLGRF